MANEKFVFFRWRPIARGVVDCGCLSLWYRSPFEIGGGKYSCAGQYLMAEKARQFGDEDQLQKILAEENPRSMEALGRHVRNTDPAKWNHERMLELAVVGNKARFEQNPRLLAFLLGTAGCTLAATNSSDRIWSIGRAENVRAAFDPGQWRGQNLLGQALMRVRADLARTKAAKEIVANPTVDYEAGMKASDESEALRADFARRDARVSPPRARRKGNENLSLDLSRRTPNTRPTLLWLVEQSIHPKLRMMTGTDLSEIEIDEADLEKGNQAKIEFDKIYRPWVYKFLLRSKEDGGCGFGKGVRKLDDGSFVQIPVTKVFARREITGEEVYSQVYMKLFGGEKPALVGLNPFRDGVGKGAFRSWLGLVVKSVLADMCKVRSMVMKDIHGHTIYKTDRHGRYLLGENGKRIPCRVVVESESEIEDNQDVAEIPWNEIPAPPDVVTRLEIAEENHRHWTEVVNLRYIAYLTAVNHYKRSSWFRAALVDMYERGIPRGEVKRDCEARGIGGGTFDKAYFDWNKRYLGTVEKLDRMLGQRQRLSSASGQGLTKAELIAEEWDKLAEVVGKSRVQDIRYRVLRNLIEGFQRIGDDYAEAHWED